MRIPKILTIIFTFSIIFFLFQPVSAGIERVIVPLQETDLYPGGDAAGFYTGIGGDLFIIDRQDEVWMFDPETGDYRDYYGFSGVELMDIVQTQTNLVWWTISDTVFGNLNLDTNAVQTWNLANYEEYQDPLNLGPIEFYDGLLWFGPYYAPYHGIMSLNLSTYELCLFESPIFASDLIVHDDLLWLTNWFTDSLMSMDPDTGQLVSYETGGDIHTIDANLQTDGTKLLWTEDVLNGSIVSFDPDTLIMTAYDLPEGEQPRNLDLRGVKVWYTNANGSFGRLDPTLAEGTTSTLTKVIVEPSMTPSCISLDDPVTDEAGREDGTFSWSDIESTKSDPQTGIQSYTLPNGAAPFGITDTIDYLWLTDPGRQKLIRMPIESDLDSYAIYLPLITK